jgi:hypothetical protein
VVSEKRSSSTFLVKVEEKLLSPLCEEGSKFLSHISEILPNYTPHIPENVFFVVTSLRIPN